MKTWVYVDGFNLYYGALKDTPFKWLNLICLAKSLLPEDHSVEKLRYFSARVSGQTDSLAPARQKIYLNALSTLPEVELHYGRFLTKKVWRPLANLPVAGREIQAPNPVTLALGHHVVTGVVLRNHLLDCQ